MIITDEQIKQNAEFRYKYASNADDKINAYIAGAHSRDEEIKEIKAAYYKLRDERN